MKLACVRAIARLAQMESSDLGSAYGGEVTSFGADYIIPRPFDPRLLTVLAPCVAEAAMESGVAVRPIADLRAYAEKLGRADAHPSELPSLNRTPYASLYS